MFFLDFWIFLEPYLVCTILLANSASTHHAYPCWPIYSASISRVHTMLADIQCEHFTRAHHAGIHCEQIESQHTHFISIRKHIYVHTSVYIARFSAVRFAYSGLIARLRNCWASVPLANVPITARDGGVLRHHEPDIRHPDRVHQREGRIRCPKVAENDHWSYRIW